MFLQQVFKFTPGAFCWHASVLWFEFIMQLLQTRAPLLPAKNPKIPKQPFKVSDALIKNSSATQK